jgi:hypothetical protein
LTLCNCLRRVLTANGNGFGSRFGACAAAFAFFHGRGAAFCAAFADASEVLMAIFEVCSADLTVR